MFDIPQRIKRREEIFPLDCAKAYEMGGEIRGTQIARKVRTPTG